MKEKRTKILLLSALAAMTLASCGGTPQVSSNPSNSSADPASAPASSEPVQESKSSQAPVDDSKPGEQSEDPIVVSDDQPEQSIPEQPSSEEQEHQDWVGQAFVGQYQGGFTGLIINEDKSTSWDTDRTHYPAILEVLDNGIYHIYSADTVPSDEKVDVYTDGTMAYLTHDAVEKDAFIVDKGAEYEAANAMAKKADGSLIFGSIMAGNKLKFFRAANGVFDFNIKVDVNHGASIEDLGAIFDVTVGEASSTYRTIVAGNAAAGQYAIIEDYEIVVDTYHGEAGDLVIARNQGEIVYVTLDGNSVDMKNVVEGEGSITIKADSRTLDDSDPEHMVWIYSAVKYNLDSASSTYVAIDATSQEDVFTALDMSQTQYTATVGEDGNLWATFTPSVSGLFNVSITSGTGENDPYDYYSTYDFIAIYRFDADSYGSPTTYAEEYAYYYYDDYYYYGDEELPEILDFEVTAGVTYIIKASNNDDIGKVLGDTGSESEGKSITISYSYVAYQVETYSGDQGLLSLESYQGVLRSVILNGEKLEKVTRTGDVLSASGTVIDFDTNPGNPTKTTTTITITLNGDGTYTYESASVSEAVFHILTEADSGSTYQTTVGDDGNLWAAFTPVESGYMSVQETICAAATGTTTGDGFIAIYNATAGQFVSKNALASDDNGTGLGKILNFLVTAGNTYIIKSGSYFDKDKDLGASGSQNAGKTEAISFVFSSILTQTFTGDAGDLLLSTEDGEFRSAKIGGEDIANAELTVVDESTLSLSAIGVGTIDATDPLDPIRTSTDTVYTLNLDDMTYTSSSSQNSRHMFVEVTSNSTTISGVVEDDGNLWLKFTAPADGYLTVEEIVSTSTDGYLAVYPSTAAAFTDDYYHSNVVAGGYADSGAALTGAGKISNLLLTAGQTYIIKGGAYDDRSKVIGDNTVSTNKGKSESIKFDFNPFDTATYSGDAGDLVIKKAGETVVSVTLGGAALTGARFDQDGNLFIEGTPAIDATDKLNPVSTSSDVIYVLDHDALTYSVSNETRTKSLFHEVTDTAVVSDLVGADGNLWIKFTAPCDGEISIEQTATANTSGDGFIALYDENAASFVETNALAKDDNGMGMGRIYNYRVTAGVTYIVKSGAYADRNRLIGGTGGNSTFKGGTETVNFTWAPYSSLSYSGDQGVLTVSMKGEDVLGVSLNGEALEGARYIEGTIVVDGELVKDEGAETYTAPRTIYALDDESESYEIVETTVTYSSLADAYTVAQSTPYFFAYDEASDSYTSNNVGIAYTDAIMTVTIAEAGYLCFDYAVSSEDNSFGIWDYLTIKVNGVALEGMEKLGGEKGMEGSVMLAVNPGDVITFSYHKDSSGDKGNDCAVISNLKVLGVLPQ